MYVVVRVRIEEGCVQSVYSHLETAGDEVVDEETDAMATDVAVVAETAVGQMMGR